MLLLGLRGGAHPRAIVTSTPKRSSKLMKSIETDPATLTTHGTTYDNAANLSHKFLDGLERRFGGTTLGRQEMYADELGDVDGALWRLGIIEPHRIKAAPEKLTRVVIGVDPPGGRTECGIVVGGVARQARGPVHGYVLGDGSGEMSPDIWGRRVIQLYRDWKADAIIAESNFGGDMVKHVIHTVDPVARVIVAHATRGKALRAEPLVGLYEQGRIHHVGMFAELEAEQTGWVPAESKESPNRVDALVWAFTDLIIKGDSGYIPALDNGALDCESPWEIR